MIRLQLLAPKEATLAERLHLEELLNHPRTFNELEQLLADTPIQNPAVRKAVTVVAQLRLGVARELVKSNPSRDLSEYYAALFYSALNAIRLMWLATVQREHALLAASLLAERLSGGTCMSGLRVLVVEDAPRWRSQIQQTLQAIGDGADVQVAANYNEAVGKLHKGIWDLVTVDLSLDGGGGATTRIDESGIVLMGQIRDHPLAARCGIVVLTGYPSTDRVVTSLRRYGVDAFVEKRQFDDVSFDAKFAEIARDARLREAARRTATTYRFVMTIAQDTLIRSELRGPRARTVYMP